MTEEIKFKVRSGFSFLLTICVFLIFKKGVIEGYNLLGDLVETKTAGILGFSLIYLGGLILLWWIFYSIIDSILINLYDKEDKTETIKIKLTKQEYDKLIDKYKVYFKENEVKKQIDYYETYERINKKLKEKL